MWLLSHDEGVILVIAIDWNRRWRASWNAGGICLRIRPGTPSDPAAFWLGVRRRATCMIAWVLHPMIVDTDDDGIGWTSPI